MLLMMASTINLSSLLPNTTTVHISFKPTRRRKPYYYFHYHSQSLSHSALLKFGALQFNSWSSHGGAVLTTRASADDGDRSPFLFSTASPPLDPEEKPRTIPPFGDSYVPLFVRMLGLDYERPDREQAVVALWKYSLGGKKCIDTIMQSPSCINLIVNLLKSESSAACEGAAGLLRSISSVNVYRDLVAECGAIEEINGLLSRPSLSPEVKEQCLCTFWNLSVDEKYRMKIANTDILPLLVKSVDKKEDPLVMEAAGGVLANLSLSQSTHNMMVEAGVIPKLANILKMKTNAEESKVIQKVARNALLELSKDKYYRVLIIEEGFIPVPLVDASAYKSFKPSLYSWPSLPDGTEIQRSSKDSSKNSGASEVLLGLNIDEKGLKMEETKINAIIGRSQQQFLARIGALEMEAGKKPQSDITTNNHQVTILPWIDGVARLVLILGLEDEVAITRAAESIADASINEHMRVSFKEAGAIKHLVQLLNHSNKDVKWSVNCALERLSVSNSVSQIIEVEGAIDPLISNLKQLEISESLMEKTLDILARILDPNKEMKAKFYGGPANGFVKGTDVRSNSSTGNMPIAEARSRNKVLDSAVISRLVEILKSSSPNLQRKAASILEFVTVIDPSMNVMPSVDLESGLAAALQQKVLEDVDTDVVDQHPEKYALQVEEAGLAISAVCRLLTKLLDSKKFSQTINVNHFNKTLRHILKSDIPLQNKDWVAACLVKLSSLSGQGLDLDSPITMEVTLYETIPRLIEQMKSFNSESREVAVVELNRIISEGVVDSTRAVALKQGIDPLVKLIEEGSDRAVEAGLAILYNLSMDSENHPAIIAAGAVPVLRRIVLSQRPQWTRALRLLRNLPV